MWLRLLSRALPCGSLALAALLASGCHSVPPVKRAPVATPAAAPAAPAAGALAADVPPPAQAVADFDRAVGVMRSGDAAEAELQFQTLAAGYPALAGPDINLGILYRKQGRLDDSEQALTAATARNAASAAAWNELGITLRLRGKFPEAAAAYEHAIAVDAAFAAAHRNLGVVLDLYLADPARALTEFERYQELSGEEKPVSVWIAELRQRTGQKKPADPAATPASPPTPSGE
jgi:tetratricopeptide (TPR) repeat protein